MGPRFQRPLHLAILCASGVWLLASASAVFVTHPLLDAASLPLLVSLAYLVAWRGYPASVGVPTTREPARTPGTETLLGVQERLSARALLMAGAVHEFKNVLSQIGLLSEAGERSASGSRERELFRSVHRHVQKARKSVAEVLDSISGGRRGPLGEVRLSAALERALRWARAGYRRDGIEVQWQILQDVAVPAHADEVEHMVLSLLDNAARAVRRESGGGSVRLTLGSREGRCVVSVEDSGPGVSDEALERLFAPGGRAGSGLGLFIARQLARSRGGDIEFCGGSRFELHLPIAHWNGGDGR
jgi:signal transduction histidine kinase